MRESQSLKRPRFFAGQLLTPADLELEQEYFRKKLKRHNRSLHGFGIVSGLKVTVNSGQIVVAPGLALDCEGNELAIETAQTIVPPAVAQPTADCHTAYVNLRFVEECTAPAPIAGTEEGSGATTLVESFELAIAQENCNRAHRHLRARWLACGQPHALTIAKLRKNSQGKNSRAWRVDRGYRPPTIK
jgi:hypothetical protein